MPNPAHLLLSLVLAASAPGQTASRPADTQPSSRPATMTQPAEPLDPAVEKILDRLEKKRIQDIEAKLVYKRVDPVIEDKELYIGLLRFRQGKPNPSFFIRFDEIVVNNILKRRGDKNLREWHVFDGQWYKEARDSTQSIIERQIVRPGEPFDAFRVGKGPFPMPFGQKKTDITRHFTIKLIAPAPKDPPNTDHLECTPREGTEMARRYGKVHFFIDRKTDVPVRVQTVEKESELEISASFTEVKLNKKMATDKLKLPDLPGFTVAKERLPSKPAPVPLVPRAK